ncbi:MAG: HupE/UreJ family protein [Pseudomonadota bacterium]
MKPRLWLAIALALSASAAAHEIRPALVQITALAAQTDAETQAPGYAVVWKQPLLGDRRLPLEPILEPDCPKVEVALESTGNALIERWTTSCEPTALQVRGLERTLTDVLVEFTDSTGETERTLLRPERTRVEFGSGGAGSGWLYLRLGVEHLLAGWDHLLFLLGLLLLIGNLRALVITVTSFTLAHSVTLALSVLGWVRLSQTPVEAGIALSIVLLAWEVLRPQQSILKQRPWLAAFAFGLLHGFGFAGALRDIGLPDDGLFVALLAFNVGIEIGQLMIIALWAALARLLAGYSRLDTLRRVAAYGIGGMAVYWTIDRVLPMLGAAIA